MNGNRIIALLIIVCSGFIAFIVISNSTGPYNTAAGWGIFLIGCIIAGALHNRAYKSKTTESKEHKGQE